MQQKINFRQSRDLGDIISITFLFLTANLKPLLMAILFISGPFILLGGIGFGLYYSFIMSSAMGGGVPDLLLFQNMGLQFILLYLILTAGSLVFFITIYEFMYLYINNMDTSVGEVWKGVKKRFPLALKVIFGSIFLMGLTFAIIGGLLFQLFFAGGSLGFFLSFITIVLSIAPFFYIAVTLSLLMSVCLFEQKGFFAGLKRSFSLIAGKWWRTFGLIFVFTLIYSGASFVFAVPMYAALGIEMFSQINGNEVSPLIKIATAASSALLLVGSYLVSSILLIGINFHYFSLAEEKDATGLLERIDSFGSISSESKNVEEY
ncbi:MAG: hypothetical protein J7604_15035 [Sporocytophaga sp.]|uniref:hypothetical protein n=1 Tax=Sporocytophaga sp. TaxID=2231183 RepID=UPI001B08626A|nr:hypothetical protein [Sporocytophaga sp.]MBO9701523.1 hypothetical protein [Sporocytophaga sp.]